MGNPLGLLGAAVLAAQPPAGEKPEGFYLSLTGTAILQRDSDLLTLGGAPIDATLDFDTGFGAQVGVGYTFLWSSVSLSLELDYAYRTSEIASVSLLGSPSPAGGTQASHSLMLNAIAGIHLTDDLGFYAGGGIGATLTRADLLLDLGGPVIVFPSDDTLGFSWQAMGGVQYTFGSRVVLYGGVTYFDAGGTSFDAFVAENISLGFVAGLRVYF